MHAELVEKKKWISEARFLHALNYCMLLPGPEAQQLATYVGWLLHKTWGGIVAGAFFVIPSIFILWTLSYIYVTFGNLPWIAAIFYGLKPAVLAIVAAAVIRIGSRALKNEVMWTLAAAAFIAIFFFHVPFPLIIISAALIGFFGGKWKRDKFLVIRGHGKANNDSVLDDTSAVPDHAKPSWHRALRVTLVWRSYGGRRSLLSFGWAPIIRWFGKGSFSASLQWSLLAGLCGAPYVAQQLSNARLAFRRSDARWTWTRRNTPGPLIIVTQFVGFLGAWNHPGQLPPILAATLGALVTTWATLHSLFSMDLPGWPLH